MYNRYVPQADGTFQRNWMEDKISERKLTKPDTQQPSCTPREEAKQEKIPRIISQTPRCAQVPHVSKKCPESANTSVLSFLQHLLPRDFDTSDLLIVLLLLIMSGDCAENQNTALLTLVLYLFL